MLKPGHFNKNYKENTVSKLLSLGRMPAKNMRNKNLETRQGKEREKKRGEKEWTGNLV